MLNPTASAAVVAIQLGLKGDTKKQSYDNICEKKVLTPIENDGANQQSRPLTRGRTAKKTFAPVHRQTQNSLCRYKLQGSLKKAHKAMASITSFNFSSFNQKSWKRKS
ncbi:hypothetical protein Tco_0541140 [Tanacetum coccineum]